MKHLQAHHIIPRGTVYKNLHVDKLIRHAISAKEVTPSQTGAVVVYTGKYTGRSPKDKFIVDTPRLHNKIDWGNNNQPLQKIYFDKLYKKMSTFLSSQEKLYIFDGFAGADEAYKLHVRVVSQYAYQSLFIQQLLRRPTPKELKKHSPQLTVLCAPDCLADPIHDGTNSEAFIVLNLEKMIVLIGGTRYTGEIKKSIFSVLNYLLPQKHVLPMHASANIGKDGTTAIFFGLSGTGKTTLSADPKRMLIGDDEHGWSKNGIFNFEGGCYAKCINLQKKSEPLIWDAIKHGSLVENAVLKKNGQFDFTDRTHTENTRVAYPLDFIGNAELSGIGGQPNYVIFLTADAFGVLPPVAKLSIHAAIYHFLSGYTSKLAGTERGVIDPKATFSAYYGAPFMPLKPHFYANLFKQFLTKYKSHVYLVNTGWIGGPYGSGKRISIEDTRTIVDAVLDGKLDHQQTIHNQTFNLNVPTYVSGITANILSPQTLWKNPQAYHTKAQELAYLFAENAKRFVGIDVAVLAAGPGNI
jgi:phosphoenolpyruvate carboxykinase (ATP)